MSIKPRKIKFAQGTSRQRITTRSKFSKFTTCSIFTWRAFSAPKQKKWAPLQKNNPRRHLPGPSAPPSLLEAPPLPPGALDWSSPSPGQKKWKIFEASVKFSTAGSFRIVSSEPPFWVGSAEGGHPDLFRFPRFRESLNGGLANGGLRYLCTTVHDCRLSSFCDENSS